MLANNSAAIKQAREAQDAEQKKHEEVLAPLTARRDQLRTRLGKDAAKRQA